MLQKRSLETAPARPLTCALVCSERRLADVCQWSTHSAHTVKQTEHSVIEAGHWVAATSYSRSS